VRIDGVLARAHGVKQVIRKSQSYGNVATESHGSRRPRKAEQPSVTCNLVNVTGWNSVFFLLPEQYGRIRDGPREPYMKRTSLFPLAALTPSLLVGSLVEAVLAGPPPAPVAKTGQTHSFGSSDDGALEKGVAWPTPRFTPRVNRVQDTGVGGGVARNGIRDGAELCNGAALYRLTGLIWLQNANCFSPRNWRFALASANHLASGQCGLRDGSKKGAWRLSNIRELNSLVDFGCVNPALSDRLGTGCFSTDPNRVFSGVQSRDYWSSTTYAGHPDFAWFVFLGFGYPYKVGRGVDLYLWPVRGAE
jgi:Protein of unknown function (DUF1566)